jgi:hypothetical protein
MTNLRKATEEYAKTVWHFDFATKAEIDQTCEDFTNGYTHAIEVLRSLDARKVLTQFEADTMADFLSQHALAKWKRE